MCIKVVGADSAGTSLADGLYSGSAIFFGPLGHAPLITEESRFIPLMEAHRYRGGGSVHEDLPFGVSASAFEPKFMCLQGV